MSSNDYQGGLLQIVSSSTNRLNGILGSHTTDNSTERNSRLPIYDTLDIIDNKCEIPRNGDTITPKHIMCYNCTDDFSIQSITMYNNYCPDSNQWLPTIISMNSWILMQRKKRNIPNYNDYLHSFKGRV